MKEPRYCTSVAILGCGVVGFSWAVVFARHGIEARLFNRPSPRLATVGDRVRTALELLRDEGVIDDGTVSESMDTVLVFDDLAAAVGAADYVQEALPEDLGLKQTTFARVAELTSADVVIASSCSGLRRADIVSAWSTIRRDASSSIRPTRRTSSPSSRSLVTGPATRPNRSPGI